MLFTHVLNWEVTSPLATSPNTVVMRTGEREYHVVVKSRDRNSFRVTRIESSVPGFTGRVRDRDRALSQHIVIEGDGFGRLDKGRGLITVFTDHPAQGKVDLPLVVIE